MKYLKLFKSMAVLFFKTSFQQEMAFRFDFIIKIFNSALSITGSIASVFIIFSAVETVNGWGLYQTLAVTGCFLFVQSIKNLFLAPGLSSVSGLDGDLWTGSFDFTLLKPIPTQLYISIREWSPLSIFDILVSLIVIGLSIFYLSITITFINVMLFVAALFLAITILYSIMLILTSVAFWYLGTPLLWIFDSFMEMGRFPIRIYPSVFRNLLTWVIPVGFVVTIPVEVLTGKASPFILIAGAVFAAVLYTIAAMFFKNSIKKYSSASS
ncbi:ABC transporter permease [Acetivibrio mesophilus]|uniref:ABC transporter permease n=1 Tax=Acetivibrio mesophilus TaxID=2487273 RepID=A0A4Q0I8H5_9FIRM|nr:ABC-2 family transporter protein [Acetivibrio mesophilus]ODM26249.1 hypothetical protein A7W90_08430 [Clostridium sp. Bc-iso-3]RXE60698.1 hypothetical protein EFD62_01910 [Acetivibrio mesophilus]HHV28111.1 hypothetical protein [Clostridium sp.]